MLACKIFNFSISFFDDEPIDQIEFFLIYFSKISLFFLFNFFESLINFLSTFFCNITAAAYTGPIRLPLPTSSTPAIIFFIKKLILIHQFFFLFSLNLSRNIFFDQLDVVNKQDEKLSLIDKFYY